MSDLVINVRQIANYPQQQQSDGAELMLMQPGLGAPYESISTGDLVATALQNASLGVGVAVPPGTSAGNVFAGEFVTLLGAGLIWNAYDQTYLRNGPAAALTFDINDQGLVFGVAPAGTIGAPAIGFSNLLTVSIAGAMALNFGTLSVARDPAYSNEVATLGWTQRNTVNSFNGRQGPIQLTCPDVYTALKLTDPIATEPWVANAIQQGLIGLMTTCPFVNSFNGRSGQVYLMLSDITCVFFQSGQQPISPNPPPTSNDNSIATTAWVTEYIANEFAGSGSTIATQTWVLANTVNSFNGRLGAVTLTATDVFDVGAAPLNSPAFSGIPNAPTANPGTSTAQLATCAFVEAAVSASTAGVASFNTRTGAVTLTNADITGAGGLANPSPALAGTPTAPTANPGTNTTQIATTQFVQAALAAGAVSSFNTRTGAVTLTLADVTGVGGAPLASPTFTGTPAAPTAAPGTSTTQLATTGFVTSAITAAGGVSSFNSRTGAVTLSNNDITAAGGLSNPNANLTGTPTAPTANPGTSTAQLATTGFVQAALAGAVTSFNTRTGAITLTAADITAAGGAVLASPNFTGSPTAPTQSAGTANTTLATTAFVQAALAASTAGVTSFNTRTGAVTLLTADITAAGGAPLASPSFTGTPLAPTASPGTSTTQLATTQFVQAAITSAAAGVASFNSRTGAVTLTNNDITAAGGAPIASPSFTGTVAMAGAANIGGALTANGVYPGYANAPSFALSADSGTDYITFASGYGWQYNRSSSQLTYTANSAAALTINSSGALNTYGGITANSGRVISSNTNTAAEPAFACLIPGTAGAGMFLNSGGFLALGQCDGNGNPTANWLMLDYAASYMQLTWATAYKPGGGTWTDNSDERLKRDVRDYQAGLDEVVQLQPVTYQFNGKGETLDDGKRYHGLVAQQARSVMPELVGSRRMKLNPKDSDATDLLTVDATPLIYALVNAVKQLARRLAPLAERIEALEARLNAIT